MIDVVVDGGVKVPAEPQQRGEQRGGGWAGRPGQFLEVGEWPPG